jgi:lipopolysaccharide transport system permease protein
MISIGKKSLTYRWIDRNFLDDLLTALFQVPLAYQLYLAKVAELRRSSGLGLIAPFVSVLVHVVLLGSVMSLVFKEPIETFIPFFAISFSLWQAISISVSESALAHDRSAQYLSFPQISGFIVHLVEAFELLFTLLFKVVAALIVIAAVNPGVLAKANYFQLIIGIVLIVLVMFAWALPISYFFDRFRILRGFLAQIIFAIYLVTPILWNPGRLANHRWVVDLNPVFHLIEVGRSPLLNGSISISSFIIVMGLILTGLLASGALYKLNRDLVVYRWIA